MATEKRLIDANELLRFLENEIDKLESSLNKWERDYVKAVRVAAKILRCFPTVDAVEVVHGRWMIYKGHFHDFAECSICGEAYGKDTAMAMNYCPNCGAKMDGDGNG